MVKFGLRHEWIFIRLLLWNGLDSNLEAPLYHSNVHVKCNDD